MLRFTMIFLLTSLFMAPAAKADTTQDEIRQQLISSCRSVA